MPPSLSQGITRRDLLKKGAVLGGVVGGVVVWVTPIVQSVGMDRAFAQTTSPPETIDSTAASGLDR